MAVQLNHLIMPSKDSWASAEFLTGVLGLEPPKPFAHFVCVEVGNGVTLDYDDRDEFVPGHFAFLVSDDEFDSIFERVTGRGITYWADPAHRKAGEINTYPGRGFYFLDPDGNNMEVLTKPFTGDEHADQP
jgi:catechol 2,3-dioxygenase-like lactoylglutathione lyase family enzyme